MDHFQITVESFSNQDMHRTQNFFANSLRPFTLVSYEFEIADVIKGLTKELIENEPVGGSSNALAI